MTNINTFKYNRDTISSKFDEGEMMILFAGNSIKSTADETYDFRVNNNFYYLTGIDREAFIFVMYRLSDKFETVLFIEKPNYDVEKWFGRKMSLETARNISQIETVKYVEDFKPWLNKIIYDGKVDKIAFDLEKLSWDEPDSETMRFVNEFKARYPFVQITSIHPVLSELRMIKSEYEINTIRKAIDLTHEGLNAILKNLKPDMFEYQLDAVFKYTIAMGGAESVSFPTIAASGENAVILHYIENDHKLKSGDLVLLDLGAKFNKYCGDITRTYPVNGKFSVRQKEIYSIVLEAHKAVTAIMKPGTPFEKLNEICKKTFAEKLTAIGLIETENELGKYYYHGVSHHLGLNVHDIGNRETVLKPGMVLTVEPGLYIAEEGIGIRIEDNVLITDAGHEVLSMAIPREIGEIERLMATV